MEKIIEFADISKLKDHSESYSQLDDSYIFCHITPDMKGLQEITPEKPIKFSGVFLLLMRGGHEMELSINQNVAILEPNTVLAMFPGQIVQLKQSLTNDLDAYVLFMDVKFLQSVNISLNSISLPTVVERPQTTWTLSPDGSDILTKYIELLHINTLDQSNPQISKQIASSLLAALFYQLVFFYHKKLAQDFDLNPNNSRTVRRHDYVREFIRLVHLHYAQERSVSFYSSKMCISPKYLSMLVRDATGRSAAKWIDDFVLTEAKNMLKFSGKNIQQVAYALNFPTQSSFGKYFKHLTGMSPTEYQKG